MYSHKRPTSNTTFLVRVWVAKNTHILIVYTVSIKKIFPDDTIAIRNCRELCEVIDCILQCDFGSNNIDNIINTMCCNLFNVSSVFVMFHVRCTF